MIRATSGVDDFLKRFKAHSTEYYREFRPENDLLPYVACTWVRVVRNPAGTVVTPIIPDGCADIMVYDDLPPWVVGPDTVTRWISLPDGVVITGIRLRPGAVRAVLGCPAGYLADNEALLEDITGNSVALHQRLMSAGDLRSRLLFMSDWVRCALVRAKTLDLATIGACSRLIIGPHLEIRTVAKQFGWNSRMMHRQFVASCGYGPKHFQRIMRVQSAIREMHSSPLPRFAEIALNAGYADQAHMTRDFRSITGFTPAGYIVNATPELGVWINDDW